MEERAQNHHTVFVVVSAVLGFLLFVGSIMLTDYLLFKQSILENGPDSFSNSIWRCEETDVCIVMDENLDCYGVAGTETIKVCFDYNRGHGVERDFEVYVLPTDSVDEAARKESIRQERVFQGKLKDCDESGFTFHLGWRSLPLWGITEPTTLHFVREDLPYSADFRDPDNPVVQEFEHP